MHEKIIKQIQDKIKDHESKMDDSMKMINRIQNKNEPYQSEIDKSRILSYDNDFNYHANQVKGLLEALEVIKKCSEESNIKKVIQAHYIGELDRVKTEARAYAKANCKTTPFYDATYQAVLCGKLVAVVQNIHNEVGVLIGEKE